MMVHTCSQPAEPPAERQCYCFAANRQDEGWQPAFWHEAASGRNAASQSAASMSPLQPPAAHVLQRRCRRLQPCGLWLLTAAGAAWLLWLCAGPVVSGHIHVSRALGSTSGIQTSGEVLWLPCAADCRACHLQESALPQRALSMAAPLQKLAVPQRSGDILQHEMQRSVAKSLEPPAASMVSHSALLYWLSWGAAWLSRQGMGTLVCTGASLATGPMTFAVALNSFAACSHGIAHQSCCCLLPSQVFSRGPAAAA